MSTFFASTFRDLGSALEAQQLIEQFNDDRVIKLVSSVVISKDATGEVTQHNGRTPGSLGAVMVALAGGVVGLVGGPAVAMLGVASGALSGGWFDLLRVQDRDAFMAEVAEKVATNQAALLGEVINPDDDARRLVEARIRELGGTLIGE